MSFLFPRFAYAPVRCAPVVRHHDLSPLFSLFDDATRQIQQAERHHAARRSQFNPRFDLKEDKESYILEGEVPGFKDEELSIEWNDNVLAIRGKHESVVESGKKPEEAAVTAETEKATAVQDTPAVESSETSSVKSHQATVEDEEPANASAVAAEKAPEQQQKTVANPAAAAQPEVQHWISERRSGQFLRQFQFPSAAVNHDAIKASLQSGILKIVVPKAPVLESRRINID